MRPLPFSRRAAFTLIELLVVIAIIGVLVSISLGVLGRVQATGNQVKCLNNLHQIGVAALSFGNDNNGLLPGPCDSGCKIYYTSNQLTVNLAPYLGLPATPNNKIVEVFRCPSWKQVVKAPVDSTTNQICYVTDNKIVLSDGTGIQVNGYPASGGNPATPPSRIALIASLEGQALRTTNSACGATKTFSMTETMYITDCDQVNWQFDSTAGWFGLLPKTPVHGSVRNTLFFDMHAAARPAALIP